jgi:hypothetical protein
MNTTPDATPSNRKVGANASSIGPISTMSPQKNSSPLSKIDAIAVVNHVLASFVDCAMCVHLHTSGKDRAWPILRCRAEHDAIVGAPRLLPGLPAA